LLEVVSQAINYVLDFLAVERTHLCLRPQLHLLDLVYQHLNLTRLIIHCAFKLLILLTKPNQLIIHHDVLLILSRLDRSVSLNAGHLTVWMHRVDTRADPFVQVVPCITGPPSGLSTVYAEAIGNGLIV